MPFSIDASPKVNIERDMNLGLLSEIIYINQKLVSHTSHYTSFPENINFQNIIPEDYSAEYQLLIGICPIHQCEILFVQNTLAPVFSESHRSRHSLEPPGKVNCKYTD